MCTLFVCSLLGLESHTWQRRWLQKLAILHFFRCHLLILYQNGLEKVKSNHTLHFVTADRMCLFFIANLVIGCALSRMKTGLLCQLQWAIFDSPQNQNPLTDRHHSSCWHSTTDWNIAISIPASLSVLIC